MQLQAPIATKKIPRGGSVIDSIAAFAEDQSSNPSPTPLLRCLAPSVGFHEDTCAGGTERHIGKNNKISLF